MYIIITELVFQVNGRPLANMTNSRAVSMIRVCAAQRILTLVGKLLLFCWFSLQALLYLWWYCTSFITLYDRFNGKKYLWQIMLSADVSCNVIITMTFFCTIGHLANCAIWLIKFTIKAEVLQLKRKWSGINNCHSVQNMIILYLRFS